MFAKIMSAGLFGIHGFPVEVEVNTANGIPQLNFTGALSGETKEGQFRVWNALKNSNIGIKPQKITVNLSPAFIRKTGTAFDLAIAIGIIKACGLIPEEDMSGYAFLGELGLDGSVKPVNGVLSLCTELKKIGVSYVVLPAYNAAEARLVEGISAVGILNIREIVDVFRMTRDPEIRLKMLDHSAESGGLEEETPEEDFSEAEPDFRDVHGQSYLKRAAEIAVSGRHNILFAGQAGSGKSMIARRMSGIMPELERDEDIEISKVYSVRGMLPKNRPLLSKRPFRAPHHGITMASFIGGGGNVLPGEISLASGGILFMDELPLFSRSVVEALRQPLEDGSITINRLKGSYVYPADFQLVAACNNCACGFYPDRSRCRCTESQIKAYMGHLSKPILERIDICAEAGPVGYEELVGSAVEAPVQEESSEEIRKRVKLVYEIQKERFKDNPEIRFNGRMGIKDIEKYCVLGKSEAELMRQLYRKMGLSARTYHKVLKVARTISDMNGDEHITEDALIEAVGFRGLEDKLFGQTIS